MFEFFKKLFKKKEEDFDDDPMDDPMMEEAIRRCFQSGKIVIANRFVDKTYEIKEIDIKE
jgi:hypothetical protein